MAPEGEIVEGGGEAMVCEARLLDGFSDEQARALFDAARDEDYEAIIEAARALSKRLEEAATREETEEVRSQSSRLRKRLSDIAAIDFFGATSRLTAEGLVGEIERKLAKATDMTKQSPETPAQTLTALKGRIWVTRKGVHVDRIACSWLIRRFIDQEAVIRFVPGKGYEPKAGELRFDMFEGEITHEGDRCSFEVLLTRVGITEPALQAISEIVHDIDLKDNKFGREETTGIASLIAGVCAANPQDEQRIAQGAAVFDNLYQFFRKKRRSGVDRS